jgi:integrase
MAKKILTASPATTSTSLDAEIAELSERLARLKAQARGKPPRHRVRDRLTDRKIAVLKISGLYSDGGNLYLDFKDPPSKNWVLRYTRGGRTRDHGLGAYPAVSLAEARLLRDAGLAKLRNGIDPVEEKRAAKLAARLERAKAMTFKQCAEAFIAAHERGWKNAKHAYQWPATLTAYVYPVFGDLPVAAVDTALVMKAIEPIWLAKTETASRTRGRIEKILDWATTAGYRPTDVPNPARWKGHLENLLPKKSKVAPVKNHEALAYIELPGFLSTLAPQTSIGALALRFAILTAARTGEVIGARWDEINFAEKLWTIPAERMKAGKEHRVPLSGPALDILATLQKLPPSPFVFPANPRRPVSNMIMLMTLRRIGRSDLTVHGFRSTFSDWCAERTNFPSELREMALAHAVGNKVEAAYRRGDMFQKRRAVMDAWVTAFETYSGRSASTRRPPFDNAESRLTTYKRHVVGHYRLGESLQGERANLFGCDTPF